jgi:hypothetical protein
MEISLSCRISAIANLPWPSVLISTVLSACALFGYLKAAPAHNAACTYATQQDIAPHPLSLRTKKSYCALDTHNTRGAFFRRRKHEPEPRNLLRRQRMSEAWGTCMTRLSAVSANRRDGSLAALSLQDQLRSLRQNQAALVEIVMVIVGALNPFEFVTEAS